MKTRKNLLTILVVLFVTTSFATEKEKMNVIYLSPEKALVAFNADAPEVLEVSIKSNESGTVYYYKSKKAQQAYRGKFNFSEMPEGDYLISVHCGQESYNSELTITKDNLVTGPVVHAVSPFVQQVDNKLNVTCLNPSEKQVYFNIYHKGDHVFGTKLGKEFCIQKRLDISDLEEGDYKVIVSDNYKDHTFTVCK